MDIKILQPCDDWEALYINGKLVAEAHNLQAEEITQAIVDFLNDGSTSEIVKAWCADEDRFTSVDGVDYLDGTPIWYDNDSPGVPQGVPMEWPFTELVPR